MFANEDEIMPFDFSGQEVVIEDLDYGLWYLDARSSQAGTWEKT